MIKDHSIDELSSHNFPLERFTIIIFFLSIKNLKFTVDFICHKILRIIGYDKNCHTLFCIGAIASFNCLSSHFSNSFLQKDRTVGLFTFRKTLFR